MSAYTFLYVVIGTAILLFRQANSGTVQLSTANIDDILKNTELVFLNFYADWCRFSQMLSPIYDETADKIMKEFPEQGRLVFAKVDCDREGDIAQRFHVSKYPTLKLVRYGELVKKEYRGQRSVDAICSFIRDQLKNPIETINNIDDIDNLDNNQRHVIGYFESENSDEFRNFRKTAGKLRDDCKFHSALGVVSEKARAGGHKVMFRMASSGPNTDIPYEGSLTDYENLLNWATDKCTPLVREITFENAEELTEEGLPFLILFYHPKDTTTPNLFRQVVAKDLLAEKSSMNFLTADGLKFSHPLQHLGKGSNDLPVLAIDSFRHMYLWKYNPTTDMNKPSLLKQFIADLHSGKLHREFHHGPDPETPQIQQENNVPAQVGFPGNQQVMRIQEQIIMRGDGVQLRIVRIVNADPRSNHDISAQLAKILHDNFEPENDSKDGEEGTVAEQGTDKKKSEEAIKKDTVDNEEHHEEDIDKIMKAMATEGANSADHRQKVQASMQNVAPPDHAAIQPERKESGSETGVRPKVQGQAQQQHGRHIADHRTEHHKEHTKLPQGDGSVVYNRERVVTVNLQEETDPQVSRTPPPSMFRWLAPSKQRYSLLRDEL